MARVSSLRFGLEVGGVFVAEEDFRTFLRGSEDGESSLVSSFGENVKSARFSLPLKLAGTKVELVASSLPSSFTFSEFSIVKCPGVEVGAQLWVSRFLQGLGNERMRSLPGTTTHAGAGFAAENMCCDSSS